MTGSDPDHGITVTEISPMDQAIHWRASSTAAFIGRALRGPLDTPVLVESVGAFTRRFGGRWRRSGLFDAVEQFFLHGGQQLMIVRVANGATGATLKLPGSDGALTLRAVEPGLTEVLRAAVDYDGTSDEEHFNLTIQRLSSETRLVVDQEIFSNVCCDASAAEFVGDALAESLLVECRLPLPASRPHATMGPAAVSRAPYILSTTRGTDGSDLCDYDLIGSAVRGTGLFSLEDVEDLDILYLPSPSAERDVGPAALLAAELYCHRRGAMLVMDPPTQWATAHEAVSGIEQSGLASPHIIGYFPRLAAADGSRPAGAAIAGLLCKLDAQQGPWSSLESSGYGFARGLRCAQPLEETDEQQLLRAGLNAITSGNEGRQILRGGITLAHSIQADVLNCDLAMKRFSMKIAKTVNRATRWAVFEENRALAAERAERQVEELLHLLAQRGAIRAAFVRCEALAEAEQPSDKRGLAIMLMLQSPAVDEPISMTLYQTASGCRIASTAFAPVQSLAKTDAA